MGLNLASPDCLVEREANTPPIGGAHCQPSVFQSLVMLCGGAMLNTILCLIRSVKKQQSCPLTLTSTPFPGGNAVLDWSTQLQLFATGSVEQHWQAERKHIATCCSRGDMILTLSPVQHYVHVQLWTCAAGRFHCFIWVHKAEQWQWRNQPSGGRTEIDHKSGRYAIILATLWGCVGILQIKNVTNKCRLKWVSSGPNQWQEMEALTTLWTYD